jgi:hypothetical protein
VNRGAGKQQRAGWAVLPVLVPALTLAQLVTGASAQAVAEGFHSLSAGPETICGITAASASEFRLKIRQAGLTFQDGGPRFDVYLSPSAGDDMVQWAVTKAGEPAFPAVTCRHMYKTTDGAWMQDRKMRCDASREACDALFVEFQQLDERMRGAIATAAGK